MHNQQRITQQQQYKKYYCTIPKWFNLVFYNWWNERFSDLCKEHDIAYTRQTGWLKADFIYAKNMWKRKYRLLAVLAFLFLQTFGWIWYFNIIKQPNWDKEID